MNTMGMTEMIAWLRAQLDSDERMAHEATGVIAMFTAPRQNGKTVAATFLRSQTPERLLRQVQAHRAILDDYARAMERRKQHPDDLASAGALLALHGVVKRLVSIYSDRDGYREEWSV